MASVTQTLIDFALSPPLGVLNAHLDANGPYGPGNHVLSTWSNAGVTSAVADTFGVYVQFNGPIPPGLGRVIGFDDGGIVVLDEFHDRMLQLVTLHQFLAGGWVATMVEDVHTMPAVVRWSESLPGKIGLYVAPDIAVDLFFLLVG